MNEHQHAYSTVQTADWVLLQNMYKHHVKNRGVVVMSEARRWQIEP